MRDFLQAVVDKLVISKETTISCSKPDCFVNAFNSNNTGYTIRADANSYNGKILHITFNNTDHNPTLSTCV